jgi:hypothetical protein
LRDGVLSFFTAEKEMHKSKEPLLQYPVKVRIWSLIRQGKLTQQICEKVYGEARPFVKSKKQLARCIAAIRVTYKKGRTPILTTKYEPEEGDITIPRPQEFPTEKFREEISKVRPGMLGRDLEKSSRAIARHILTKLEKFTGLEDGPNKRGTPFDFFGFKNGVPYIIEMKSSLHHFNVAGLAQKRRMRELLHQIPKLKVALIQIAVKEGRYRIFSDEQVKGLLFADREAAINPIRQWIEDRINGKKHSHEIRPK